MPSLARKGGLGAVVADRGGAQKSTGAYRTRGGGGTACGEEGPGRGWHSPPRHTKATTRCMYAPTRGVAAVSLVLSPLPTLLPLAPPPPSGAGLARPERRTGVESDRPRPPPFAAMPSSPSSVKGWALDARNKVGGRTMATCWTCPSPLLFRFPRQPLHFFLFARARPQESLFARILHVPGTINVTPSRPT